MDTCTIAPAGTAERRMNMLSGAKVTKELLNALDNVKKQQTNAQKIRSMTDEELAKILGDKCICPPTGDCPKMCGDCDICWLEWLQQPAEEE